MPGWPRCIVAGALASAVLLIRIATIGERAEGTMTDANGITTAVQWLELVTLGGVAGALGQGVRMAVGLKKLNDQAATSTQPEPFQASRLATSLFVGFTAGAVAAISTVANVDNVSLQQFVALAGAGYSGADVVEGLVSRGGLAIGSNPTPPVKPDGGASSTVGGRADDYVG